MSLAVAGQRITANLLNKNYFQSDTTTISLTNPLAQTSITTGWSIPANDANLGTVYMLDCFYTGTWEASGNFNLGWTLNASANNLVPVAAGVATAGHAYGGVFRIILQITATGSSGTYNLFSDGNLSDETIARAAANTVALNGSNVTGKAIDTTAVNTLFISAFFSTTNASQTVVGQGSVFIRGGA